MAWEINVSGVEGTIGILHKGIVSVAWALAFKKLIHGNVKFSFITGSPFDVARNTVVKEFLNNGGEYLFFLDTDVVVNPTTIVELREISKVHNLGVVAALYWRRYPPIHIAAWVESEKEPGKYEPIPTHICKTCGARLYIQYAAKSHADINGHDVVRFWDKDDVLKVDAVHMGATLIKRWVFEKLMDSDPDKPFFYYTLGKDGGYGVGKSEDFYFCERIRKELGIRPAVATGVVAHHIANTFIDGYTGEVKFIAIG